MLRLCELPGLGNSIRSGGSLALGAPPIASWCGFFGDLRSFAWDRTFPFRRHGRRFPGSHGVPLHSGSTPPLFSRPPDRTVIPDEASGDLPSLFGVAAGPKGPPELTLGPPALEFEVWDASAREVSQKSPPLGLGG